MKMLSYFVLISLYFLLLIFYLFHMIQMYILKKNSTIFFRWFIINLQIYVNVAWTYDRRLKVAKNIIVKWRFKLCIHYTFSFQKNENSRIYSLMSSIFCIVEFFCWNSKKNVFFGFCTESTIIFFFKNTIG